MKNGRTVSKYKFKFYTKPHYKVICIKHEKFHDIKPGDVFIYMGIKMCMSAYDGYCDLPRHVLQHEDLEYWISPEFFNECFMLLAEWRDKQIDKILYDNNCG
jgi:hypothetical protein